MRTRKPKQVYFPNMDNFTEEDLPRNYQTKRFSTTEIYWVHCAVEANNFAALKVVGMSKKQMEAAKKAFDKLRKEYENDRKPGLYSNLIG
jgi:hypothetical protein